MYELVNTSAPNGLIPGTHGFATVAMTKGMPDAIRTRVEGLCAYPHRTSAHDESYCRENPVNWFHLTLPSGDHVVGRTAPCAFDYTGRTNRLARTITLKKGEMPQGGGVTALRLAASRLAEKWSGEPRMLKQDKTLAAQFFVAERRGSSCPRNWIALLGERGEELARRIAILVAQNGVGKGKSLYFKVSTGWDVDGTKLLGLFGDIIALLPDEMASLVTFSTFSACVPSGTVCHLRGIYDKDRAFEVASATQPWVDCENARIVHEEMLPEAAASASREDDNGVEGTDSDAKATSSARIGIVVDSALRQQQAAQNRVNSWRGEMLLPNESSDKMFYVVLGILAVVVLGLAIGCYVWVKGSTTASSGGTDEIAKFMENDRAETDAQAKEERAKAEREERARKEQEEAKRKEAERVQHEKEATAKKAAEAEKEAGNLREQAERKQKEESKRAEEYKVARKNNLEVSLGKLKITKVIDATKISGLKDFEIPEKKKPDTDRYMLASHVSNVTNAESVIVYYVEGGSVKSSTCHIEPKYLKTFGKTRFKVQGWPEKSKDSPWAILRVINPAWRKGDKDDTRSLDVFWWWNEIPKQNLFEQSDSADLKKICFGSDAAKNLYETHGGKVYYLLKWDDKIWIQEDDTIQMKQFCDDKELVRLKEEYDDKIAESKNAIDAAKNKKEAVEDVLKMIKNRNAEKQNIKDGVGGFARKTKGEKDEAMTAVDNKIVTAIQKLDPKKYHNINATNIDSIGKNLQKEVENLGEKIEKLKNEQGKLKNKQQGKCDKKKLEEAVRKRVFQVQVADRIPEGMRMGENKRKAKGE